jgi:preprotein translocase subunit SecD
VILSRRALLVGLAAVVLAAGCTSTVHGAAQPVPTPSPAQQTVAPENIQFRLVVTDGTGGVILADREGKQYVVGPVLLDGTKVESARAEFQSDYGNWIVTVHLTSQGAAVFGQVTTDNVNAQLALVVDEVVVSAPVIQGPITDGAVQIAGQFTQQEATLLANRIMGR